MRSYSLRKPEQFYEAEGIREETESCLSNSGFLLQKTKEAAREHRGSTFVKKRFTKENKILEGLTLKKSALKEI